MFRVQRDPLGVRLVWLGKSAVRSADRDPDSCNRFSGTDSLHLEGSQKSLSDGRPCRLNDLGEQSGGASRGPSLRELGLIGVAVAQLDWPPGKGMAWSTPGPS